MTQAELLAATGNAWRVRIYQNGKCRRLVHTAYIRARTAEGAKRTAIQLFGGRYAVAYPWNPETEYSRFIRRTG